MDIRQSKAGKSISIATILRNGDVVGDGRTEVGRIYFHYGDTGRVNMELFDWTNPEKTHHVTASAGGYGYCKKSACMARQTFGDTTLSEGSWESDLDKAGYTLIWVI